MSLLLSLLAGTNCWSNSGLTEDLRRHGNHLTPLWIKTLTSRSSLGEGYTGGQHPRSVRFPLQWRHDERDCVSNHRRLHCLLNCWLMRRSKKTSKLRVTGLCDVNSPVTGEFPAQQTSNAKMFPLDYVIMLHPSPSTLPPCEQLCTTYLIHKNGTAIRPPVNLMNLIDHGPSTSVSHPPGLWILSSQVDQSSVIPGPPYLTKDFLFLMQLWWKKQQHLLSRLLVIRSLQNYAHATTAKLSRHVRNFIAIPFF